jgi:MFS family permease
VRREPLLVLALATAVGSAGLAAGGTAGALLGAELADTEAAAGLPLGLLVVGQAAAAILISRRTARVGRSRGLALGYVLGTAGAALVVFAISAGSLAVFLAGSVVLGAGNTAVFMTRYAAAEVGGEAMRGRALGAVFFATALGAVASPGLLGPSGDLARTLGLPPLTGLYVVSDRMLRGGRPPPLWRLEPQGSVSRARG